MDFVVFSDDWGRHPSSCQHLFGQLMRRHRVLWVNTIGMRAPKMDGFTAGRSLDKLTQWRRPLKRINENLHVYSPPMMPVTGSQLGGSVNASLTAARIRRVMNKLKFRNAVLFSSIPTGADYVGRLGESALVYYITDNYKLWPGAAADVIADQDELLKSSADLLLPVGAALAEGLDKYTGKTVPLPHAVDLEHFSPVRSDQEHAEPADIADIPHPRLCFFGLIYEKIDIDLLKRAAHSSPENSLVLIGPVKCDLSALSALPNVHILGPKSYQQLPAYLDCCDTLLLAYKLDDQTLRNAPLKIRECLAAGKSVIARRIPDLDQYAPLLNLAHSDDEFIELFKKSAELQCEADAMRAAIAADTWSARAESLETELASVVAGVAGGAGVAGVAGVVAGPQLSVMDVKSSGYELSLETDASQWERYIATHDQGSVWNSSRWLDVMRESYGLECMALSAHKDGRICGVLPLAAQSSFSFGSHLLSLPWLDRSGILADDDNAYKILLEKALELAAEKNSDLCIRELKDSNSPDDERITAFRGDKVSMVLDLGLSSEQLWHSLGSKVRNQVRKAEKSELVARWAGPAELELFYEVYARNMRDLGSPPHSLKFFARVMEHFSDIARIMLVMQEDQTVAAGFVLRDQSQWQIPWASSLRKYNSLCPNHLMYWSILSEACCQTQSFCFGRSSRDSGTYRFKAQWGCSEQELAWRYWLGKRGCDNRPSPTAELISRAWRHIPVSVARRLGPSIVKVMG